MWWRYGCPTEYGQYTPIKLADGNDHTDVFEHRSVLYYFSELERGSRKLPPLLTAALKKDFPILRGEQLQAVLSAAKLAKELYLQKQKADEIAESV